MSNELVFKPVGDNTRRFVAVLPNRFTGNTRGVDILDSSGNVVESGRFRSVANGGRGNWDFGKPGNAYGGTQIRITLDNGEQIIRNYGGSRYTEDFSSYGGGGSAADQAGGQASSGGGLSGGGVNAQSLFGGAGGGAVGATSLPFDISGLYPNFEKVSSNPIEFGKVDTAPYKFTDTIEFGKKFGDANRENFKTNFDQSQELGLKTLDTELKGLQAFAPAASALKREQTSLDNTFNQAQRTEQVDTTLQGARGVFDRAEQTLNRQGDRAATYAQGRLTDDQLDRALELGIRSGAADTASFGGFGPRSQQASKISDLQSAEARFQIAQYGEGLTSQNVQEQQNVQANRANLFLAPTSYSDAGAQVRINPEVGAGRAATQALGALNEATLISPGQALSTEVQQNQFETQNENRVREFNTTGVFQADSFNSSQKFQADTYNSQGQFAADLGLFNYQAGYVAQLQAANQSILNNEVASQVGMINQGTFNSGLQAGQNGQAIQSTIQGTGGIMGAGGGIASTAMSGFPAMVLGGQQGVGSTSGLTSGGQADGGQVGSVGGSSGVDTSSASAPVTTGGSANQSAKQLETSSTVPSAGSQGGAIVRPIGADNSVAGGYRFDGNSPVPSGYTPALTNSDGSVTAVRNSDYTQDLQRFSQFGGNPNNAPLALSSMAMADRALASAAGLSFHPSRGFQPMGLTSNGGAVSSLPNIANSGDGAVGGHSVSNIGTYMGSIGAADPDTAGVIRDVASFSGDPSVQAALDDVSATGGKDAVTGQILATLGQGIDPNTPSGARVVAGAMRIGEQWDNFSPAQKSLALSSLADPLVESRTGTAIGNKVVKGTERTAHGGLKTREVTQMINQGVNGVAMANNWDQVAAIGQMIGGSRDNVQAGIIGSQLGMGGYGPQGASIPIEKGQLEKVGAEAAPQYGVGAATFPSATTVPQGYEVVTQTPEGKIIAIPKTHTSTGVFKQGSISPLVFKKTQAIAQGSHKAQSGWLNNAPNKGAVKGAAGGTAILSGLDKMREQAPQLYNAVAARSLFMSILGAD